MANSIEFAKNYTGILDEVYQRAAVSRCLNSGGRMVRAGRNAKEILIPKISVTGLGDYTRNVGYKTGSITYEYETHSFGYDRAIRLFADVMDVEESGVLDCFVEAGAELQRTQVAPEGDAYTFSQIASTEGVTVKGEDLSEASAVDVLAALRAVTNGMDDTLVSTGSRHLFITPSCAASWTTSRLRTRRAPTACSSGSAASWRCRRYIDGVEEMPEGSIELDPPSRLRIAKGNPRYYVKGGYAYALPALPHEGDSTGMEGAARIDEDTDTDEDVDNLAFTYADEDGTGFAYSFKFPSGEGADSNSAREYLDWLQ